MKVIDLKSLEGTDRDTFPSGCRSLRFLIASDGAGFSVHKTMIPKGFPNHWHYPHHVESCYCVSGKGILTNYDTGNSYDIVPDTLYLLQGDDHSFQALEDTVLISVFNPPVNGDEVHDENGCYPKSKGLKDKAVKIVKICNESDSDYDAIERITELI